MYNQDQTSQRWTAKRKTQVIVEILKGKLTIAEVGRQYDLTPLRSIQGRCGNDPGLTKPMN